MYIFVETCLPQLATHCCQLVFVGETGFRFPVAHYNTADATADELVAMVSAIEVALGYCGFKVIIYKNFTRHIFTVFSRGVEGGREVVLAYI